MASVAMKAAESVMVAGVSGKIELAANYVTFGVTWGEQGFASASCSACPTSDAQRMSAVAKLTGGEGLDDGSRGKFVEIIFSQVSRKAAKPLKKMVGATGIEPVTPTMSR
jgi:hypothetical protein